jgi:hypothetical protein
VPDASLHRLYVGNKLLNAEVMKRNPPFETFFEGFWPLDDFAVGVLATEGSTRRMARDGRPSRPASPARCIQTDRASGVMNCTTSSMSGMSAPCNSIAS